MSAKPKVTTNRLCLGKRLDFHAIEALAKLIPQLVESSVQRPGNTCIFDLTDVCWADLMELMCLFVAADWVRSAGLRPAFRFSVPGSEHDSFIDKRSSGKRDPSDGRGEFLGFCKNFRFVDLIAKKSIKTNWEPSSSRKRQSMSEQYLPGMSPEHGCVGAKFVPITHVSRDSLEDIYKLMCRVTDSFLSEVRGEPLIPPEQRRSLCDKIVFELCENALLHAYRSRTCWSHLRTVVFAVRCWRSAKTQLGAYLRSLSAPDWLRSFLEQRSHDDLLEVCLVDGGVGIYPSLLPTYASHVARTDSEWRPGKGWSEEKLLRLAFSETPLSSQHDGDPTRGLGLYWMYKHVVQAWKGCLYLRTGRTRVVADPSQPDELMVSSDLPWFPGVQFRIWLQMFDNSKIIRTLEQDERQGRVRDMSLFRIHEKGKRG